MDYIEITIPCPDTERAEIMMAQLSDLPFESFETTDTELRAYIPAPAMEAVRAEIETLLRSTGMRCTEKRIEERNWNAEWEASFEPVVCGDIVIRAPFHEPAPQGKTEVIIMPKMSFGTGHHATTRLVTMLMDRIDFKGSKVLDMGSGTGVLSIIAVRMGAASVDAVDIDEWAYNNCMENIAVNGVEERVTPILGDVSAVGGRSYDIVLANINRNVLCRDMEDYSRLIVPGGVLIISGILEEDLRAVDSSATQSGFGRGETGSEEGWAGVVYWKISRPGTGFTPTDDCSSI
ncbi:MAG: 50S ribosomal protein L11 methyltransferase [Rikenellaceae bacterium]|nr:50S ribosomal protein L11 methyltransferase [Rikenellaceae bacterium]